MSSRGNGIPEIMGGHNLENFEGVNSRRRSWKKEGFDGKIKNKMLFCSLATQSAFLSYMYVITNHSTYNRCICCTGAD